jgi:hypothetical protein
VKYALVRHVIRACDVVNYMCLLIQSCPGYTHSVCVHYRHTKGVCVRSCSLRPKEYFLQIEPTIYRLKTVPNVRLSHEMLRNQDHGVPIRLVSMFSSRLSASPLTPTYA